MIRSRIGSRRPICIIRGAGEPQPATGGSGLTGMTTVAAARTIAIGDIHGCLLALNAILGAIDPQPDDVIVTLGDYVNRGPDSRRVLERLIALAGQCRLVPILGNHDEMLLQARYGLHPRTFLGMGGIATLASYGASSPPDVSVIPDEHIAFLETCVDYHETETHIFRDFLRCGGQGRTVSPVDVTAVRGSQLTYYVE